MSYPVAQTTVKSFRALAAYIAAEDRRKAENLRKSQSLTKNRKPGSGPRVAR